MNNDQLLEQINKRFEAIEKNMATKDDLKGMATKEEQQKQGKAIRSMKKIIDLIGLRFNADDVEILKRVRRIEEHLNMPPYQSL